MPLPLVVDAYGDPRNAKALAIASDLAYLSPADGVPAFRDKLGLEAKLIAVDNTQVYVGHNDEHIVAAFRGTEAPTSIDGLKDWLLTDAANLLIVPQGRLGTDLAAAGVSAKFHQGFVGAIAEIWDPFLGEIKARMDASDRPLWITGHSLGGALALLAAWLLHRSFISVHQIYTFGGPMIGNKAASDAFNREFKGQVFRYVNGPDPVPRLPTISLMSNDFLHCDAEVTLGTAAGSTVEFFKQLLGKAVQGAMNASLSDEVWALVKARIDAHSVTNYDKLLKEKFG